MFEEFGELYSAGWLGKVRVFFDPTSQDGLMFFWIPKIKSVQPGKAKLAVYETFLADTWVINQAWVGPLQMILVDDQHPWDKPVATFTPEPAYFAPPDEVLDNPKPCSAFPLRREGVEERAAFTLEHLKPGSKLIVLFAQPVLRLDSVDAKLSGKGSMFFPAKLGQVPTPSCLAALETDPTEIKDVKEAFLSLEYLAALEEGGPPSLLMSLNMVYQIPACQQWLNQAGIPPVEIVLYENGIAPLPEIIRKTSLHPQQNATLCHQLSSQP
jgi:hypothetical protein